jgi:hypothetical protein
MPSEKEKDAAALIAEAKHWIRNTRRFASNIEDQQAKAAIGKIYWRSTIKPLEKC